MRRCDGGTDFGPSEAVARDGGQGFKPHPPGSAASTATGTAIAADAGHAKTPTLCRFTKHPHWVQKELAWTLRSPGLGGARPHHSAGRLVETELLGVKRCVSPYKHISAERLLKILEMGIRLELERLRNLRMNAKRHPLG